MEDLLLVAEPRAEFGKSAAKRVRREGKIPAVMYGVSKTQHVLLNAEDFNKKFRHISDKTIVSLEVGSKKHNVLVKDYHYDIVRDRILHVDLFEFKKEKAVKTKVPVVLTGHAIGERDGGTVKQILAQVEIESMPMFTPKEVKLDISNLKIGDKLTVAEIIPVENVQFVTKPETEVATLEIVQKAAPVEEE